MQILKPTLIIFLIITFYSFALHAFSRVRKLLKLLDLVKSKETYPLSTIADNVGKTIELYSEINGDFLISPISKTKCVKYIVEVYYETRRSGAADSVGAQISEEKIAEDVYILDEEVVISIDLREQKRVYSKTFDWNILKQNEKYVVEEYLNRPENKAFVDNLGYFRNRVIGVRESVIEHAGPVYLLGEVVEKQHDEGEFISSKRNLKYLPYTINGYIDSESEIHFIKYLKKKLWIAIYTMTVFIMIPTFMLIIR